MAGVYSMDHMIAPTLEDIKMITFPVPLSMNSLQKILYNKTMQEESKITVHVHTMALVVKITLHVHTMALAIKTRIVFVSNFRLKSQSVQFRTQIAESNP